VNSILIWFIYLTNQSIQEGNIRISASKQHQCQHLFEQNKRAEELRESINLELQAAKKKNIPPSLPTPPVLTAPHTIKATCELESLVKQLELQVNKLQQENYELQSTASNMVGIFSTLEEVVQHYSYLGEQQLVDFILDFKDKCTPSDQFIDFLATLTQGVHTHVTSQHDTFFQNIFPGPLHNLASWKSQLNVELHTHLQNNYKSIMQVGDFGEFVPKEWQQVAGFSPRFSNIVGLLHDIFWQIKLTPQLHLGVAGTIIPHVTHKSPLQSSNPKVVLHPLTFNEKIIACGYLYWWQNTIYKQYNARLIFSASWSHVRQSVRTILIYLF
jgi:hypothetical protein